MKRSIAVAALSGLLLVTAACGSDEGSSSATDATTADSDAPAASETTGAGTDATEAATPATGAATGDTILDDELTIPDISFPDVSLPDLSEISIPDLSDITLPEGLPPECMAYATAFLGAYGALDGTGDVDVEAIDQAFSDLRGMVPDELKDDVDVMAGAMGDLLSILADYGFDLTKVMADPEAAAKLDAMSNDEVTTAQTNLEDYLDGICGDELAS